jgi:hypothetical protein
VFKNALAVLLTALLVLPVQGGQQTSPTIEKQVGQIARGSTLVVTTNMKKMKKGHGPAG